MGWKQPIEFLWFDVEFRDRPNEVFVSNSNLRCRNDFVDWVAYPALIATELLEELPREVSIKQYPENDSVRYQVGHNADKIALQTFKYNNNLCDALAEMWLYLKEKGLLCPKFTGGIT